MASRMMTLVAFLQAQNCSNLPGSWRHPATTLVDAVKPNAQRVTVCRLGFMLERAGAPASVLSPLHDRSGGKYLDLDPGLMRGGPLESTWRLRLNVELQP